MPQIVLAERKDKRGKFIVIDGKQRLLALRQFHAKPDDIYSSFKLSDLSIRTDLIGVDYDTLSSNLLMETDHDALENSTIRTAVIRNWEDENFLYTIFLRLNTGSVPLSPQELRQALHPGEFVKFVDDYSSKSDLLQTILGLSKPDPRMRDAELVIRYFAFRNFLDTYTGNLKPLLDQTANYFNKIWRRDFDKIAVQRNDFERALVTAIEIFGEKNAFRKWSGHRYERPFNRAVFDVLTYYFDSEETSIPARERKLEVEAAFKQICLSEEFRTSIEGTTKSIEAIFTRLSLWGKELAKIDVPVTIPQLIENKIVRGG